MATDTSIGSGFWPLGILKEKILTPIEVLAPRADELSIATNGVLIGQMTERREPRVIVLHFDVIAPKLNNLRKRLLTVRHDQKMVYPVTVEASIFPRSASATLSEAITGQQVPQLHNRATTDTELAELIRAVFHSDEVKSTLASLLALSQRKERST